MTDEINTPRGATITGGNGKAQLVWNTNFRSEWQGRYTRAQQFIDSEVLRRCEPYIPLRTGTLIKSGILGTQIGSGLVQWIAPYARRQYYRGRQPGTSNTGSRRGRQWFQRMKAVSLQSILNGARRLMNASQ